MSQTISVWTNYHSGNDLSIRTDYDTASYNTKPNPNNKDMDNISLRSIGSFRPQNTHQKVYVSPTLNGTASP